MEPLPKSATSGSLTTSCGAIHYLRCGAGPVVLLLHGLGSSLRSFHKLIPRLAERHQVLAADLLGHGGSSLDPVDLSAEAQAQAVFEVTRELGIGELRLVGHSFGGAVALRLAALAPRQTLKLALLAGGCGECRLPHRWRILRGLLPWALLGLLRGSRAWTVHRLRRIFFSQTAGAECSFGTAALESRAAWTALGRALRQSTCRAALSALEGSVELPAPRPTLIVWGSDDRFVPAAAARVLFQGESNVRFIEVRGGSHFLHEEEPEIVTDLVLEFLA